MGHNTAMKYVLVIPDGVADEPQGDLGGRTPLQAAQLPHMDEVARSGVVGRTDNVPPEMPSGSDVGTMSLFGYAPRVYHTGRAPLEAAAQGIELGPQDWAIRCNLVTIEEGRMVSFTADQIPSPLAAELMTLLQDDIAGDPRWEFHAGVSYRNLLIYRGESVPAPFSEQTRTVPPHDLTDQPIVLPEGPGADVLRELMELSVGVFAGCASNQARRQDRARPATQIWLWGLGRVPQLPAFRERFGVSAAVITAVDLLRGIGRLLGWDVIEVDGATGYTDTDYAAKGRAAIDTLADHDFVVVHVEATDEASHEGDAAAKVRAVEQIDQHIVGPVHAYLKSQGPYRLMVCPDHPTFLRTKTHSHGYCPFAVCGTDVPGDDAERYDEVTAAASSLVFNEGHQLLPAFLSAVPLQIATGD